jgi:serine acetyltransferase
MAAVVTRDVLADIVVMGHPARMKYPRAEYNRKKAE